MWQTGGPPVLYQIAIVKLLTQHVIKRRLLGTHQWQSVLLVVGLPVTQDWFEMGCHLSPSLISIRLTACRTSTPRKRRGNHKQTRNRIASNTYSFIEVFRSERIMRNAENSFSTLTCVDGKAVTVYATFCKMAG